MFLLRLTLSQGRRKTGRHILSHKQTNKQPGRNEPYSQLCWKFLGKILVLKKPGLFTLITIWLYPQQVSSIMPLISHWFPSPYHIESKEAQVTDLAWCPISCPHFLSPFSPNSIRSPHSSLVCFLLQLYFGFLASHEGRKGRNHVYLYLVTVMLVPNTDIETWLMLNKYLLGKDIFVNFQETLRPNNTSLERIRGMLHWAWTLPTWFRCPLNTSTPRTLPGSSYLLDFLVFDGFHYVFMTVHCLYTCFLGTITITIFSFCTTTAILSVSKLISLIIISLPFWTKVENFCLQTPGGNLHLDVVSIWN